MLSATTLGGWAAAIAMALEHFGIDPEPIFNKGGICLAEARNPSARFPTVQMAKLMRIAADTANDPAFGLHVGRFMRPTSWHALGFSIWASQNLRQGFERLVRYKRIFTTCGDMWIEESDGVFRFEALGYPEYQNILQPEEYDAFWLEMASQATEKGVFGDIARGAMRMFGVTPRALYRVIARAHRYATRGLGLYEVNMPANEERAELRYVKVPQLVRESEAWRASTQCTFRGPMKTLDMEGQIEVDESRMHSDHEILYSITWRARR